MSTLKKNINRTERYNKNSHTFDLLVNRVVDEVLRRLKEERGLSKAEEKLNKYPNLKYRKPKYKNVSEVLKYVESDKGKPDGVKLVIMNFND